MNKYNKNTKCFSYIKNYSKHWNKSTVIINFFVGSTTNQTLEKKQKLKQKQELNKLEMDLCIPNKIVQDPGLKRQRILKCFVWTILVYGLKTWNLNKNHLKCGYTKECSRFHGQLESRMKKSETEQAVRITEREVLHLKQSTQ